MNVNELYIVASCWTIIDISLESYLITVLGSFLCAMLKYGHYFECNCGIFVK